MEMEPGLDTGPVLSKHGRLSAMTIPVAGYSMSWLLLAHRHY